jgi:hypothetical protein
MTIRKSYKKKDLNKYIEENNIELIGEYETVNRETRIKGKCKTDGCDEYFEKGFAYLLNNGEPICTMCISNKRFKKKWLEKLEECKQYIDDNNKRPTEDIILGRWLQTNTSSYIIKDKYFMKNYLEEWRNFINDPKYIEYFKTDDEKWKDKLDRCKKFMDSKNKRPRAGSNDENEKSLGQWITDQFKKKTKKNEYREKLWNEFIIHPKYYKYMRSLKDIWTDNIEKLKKFIDVNERVPTAQEEDKPGIWFQQQKLNIIVES